MVIMIFYFFLTNESTAQDIPSNNCIVVIESIESILVLLHSQIVRSFLNSNERDGISMQNRENLNGIV